MRRPGAVLEVSAEAVVICAGVWTDLVHELAGVQAGYKVRMSKGVHIVVPRAAVDADTGMILRTEKSVLFFIPWGEHWIVGTTDTDFSGDRAEPVATEEDIEYILAAANRVLARPLTRADVIGVYAGLRPLVDPAERGQRGQAHHQAVPRARGRHAGSRPGQHRGRQVHHLPADGQGRGRRRRGGLRTVRCPAR